MSSAVRRLAVVAWVVSSWLTAAVARADCFNGVLDGPESDVDCGGDCVPCEIGLACKVARDCMSGRCGGGFCEDRPWTEGEPVPRGYQVERSDVDAAAVSRKIGLITLGVGYGAGYVAALSLPGEVSWLYAPIVGPWVVAFDSTRSRRGLIALDAAVQTVGAALLVGGIIGAGDHLVRSPQTVGAWRFQVMPSVMGDRGYGARVFGAF